MSTRQRTVLVLLVWALLLLSVAVSAQRNSYVLFWQTTDGGGGTLAGKGYALTGTVGQPDVVVWSGRGYTVAGGFWGNHGPVCYSIYLPLIVRE